MKTYGELEVKRHSGQRHTPAVLFQGKEPPVPLERRLSGSESRSGSRSNRTAIVQFVVNTLFSYPAQYI
jgi:hypothetical protein